MGIDWIFQWYLAVRLSIMIDVIFKCGNTVKVVIDLENEACMIGNCAFVIFIVEACLKILMRLRFVKRKNNVNFQTKNMHR